MKNAKEAGADIYISLIGETHHLKECQVLLLKGCSDVDHEHSPPPPPPPTSSVKAENPRKRKG